MTLAIPISQRTAHTLEVWFASLATCLSPECLTPATKVRLLFINRNWSSLIVQSPSTNRKPPSASSNEQRLDSTLQQVKFQQALERTQLPVLPAPSTSKTKPSQNRQSQRATYGISSRPVTVSKPMPSAQGQRLYKISSSWEWRIRALETIPSPLRLLRLVTDQLSRLRLLRLKDLTLSGSLLQSG